MWDIMPTKINIFSLDTPIKNETKSIYNFDPLINNFSFKNTPNSIKESICKFWNNHYNVTDDYSHNYSVKSFEWIFEEDDELFFLLDKGQITGTIVGKIKPFISIKKSFNVVIVDFLCVHPKFRSKGIATKLIQSLAYWFEDVRKINVHIFHRELTKCPYWALSNSTYWFLDLNSGTPFQQKSFNTKIKNKNRFQILCQTNFQKKSLELQKPVFLGLSII
jgi:GNAT superfamily N-acetyltransferase